MPDGNFHVFPDKRATQRDPEELLTILNAGAAKYGMVNPYRLIQFKDSKDSRIIQAVDVVVGSIAYVLKGRGNQPGAAAPKRALSEFIQSRKPLVPSFGINTPPSKKAFNIWHFRLSE
jgi:hypothetical protein